MTLLNNFLASLPFMNAERADEVISSFWPMLEAAIDKTIPLAVISFFAGVAIALLVALIRIVEKPNLGMRLLQILCRIYVSTIRGTPMLVQIFIIFYGLPEVGIKLDPFPTAIIAFSINIGAYASETIRAAILSIPKGQWESCAALGLNRIQTLKILIPYALKRALPSYSNEIILVFKGTALASTITIMDIMGYARQLYGTEYDALTIYGIAGGIYLIITGIATLLLRKFEKKVLAFERFEVSKA